MKKNIKITGDGIISSGEYYLIKIIGNAKSNTNCDVVAEEVKVIGDAKLNGNMDFKTYKVTGDSDICGTLKANKTKVNGNFHVEGSCDIDELVVNGDCRISDDFKCNNVIIRGDLEVNKSLYAKEIKVYGNITIKGNIECETIDIKGRIKCEGLLNAENVIVYPMGRSFIKEIGASNIEIIKQSKSIWTKLFSFGSYGNLKSEIIEADYIKLENVDCDVVRGKDIELIKNCNIKKLEYSNSLQIGNDCVVEDEEKIG